MIMNLSLQRIVNIIVVILLLMSCNPSASTGLKVAAWHIGDSIDIPPLEKKGFNLFFIGEDFSQQAPADQDAAIQKYINALGPGSQIVLSIQPWIQYNWFTGGIDKNGCLDRKENSQVSTGLEEFINRWGGSDPQYPKRDRIYGFLLADDVQLTPFGEACKAQPKNALWVVRWFYQMIRNRAEDQRNGYDRDLAPGKPLLVTMPFNPQPKYWNKQLAAHVNMGNFDIPPAFFTPGEAFDIVAPYYYPHLDDVTAEQQIANMNVVYPEMARLFPNPATRMPILQATGGCNSLAFEPDLRLQLNQMITYGLGIKDAGVLYFTARWHQNCNTLLQYDNALLATDENPYYQATGVVNGYLLNTPIGPVTTQEDQ